MIDGDGDGGKHTRKRKYQARKVHDRASCIRIKSSAHKLKSNKQIIKAILSNNRKATPTYSNLQSTKSKNGIDLIQPHAKGTKVWKCGHLC